ncbi:unnamed protein product, partial [marine sediment metagenome]
KEKAKMKCPICGKQMQWFVETLLCPVCDHEQLWELKYDHQVRRGEIKNE